MMPVSEGSFVVAVAEIVASVIIACSRRYRCPKREYLKKCIFPSPMHAPKEALVVIARLPTVLAF